MKRKVGELNNIPIIEGDPNLLKSNELLHKGGGKLSKRNKEGSIEDLASNSSDVIYVGVKNPYLDDNSISEMNLAILDISIGVKYTNACYIYHGLEYASYEDFYSREYVMAIAIPVIPEFPNNIFNCPTFSTFAQFRLAFIKQGFTEQEFDSQFYEITKEEFFTPFGEYTDILTLQIDDKELIVDFAAGKWFLTGEGWKDINKDTNTVGVVGLLRLPYEYRQVVYNNVKYETNTNNYVEYYNKFSSDVYYNGRIKTNGIGPDLNYGEVDAADGYRHSSGIIIAIIE